MSQASDVQATPSSQASITVQRVLSTAALHFRHSFIVAPFTRHAPSIMQLPSITS
jgi:hypothetical protein